MSFIAKNPLSAPMVKSQPPTPMSGTRGIYADENGWWDITNLGTIDKFVTTRDLTNTPEIYAKETIEGMNIITGMKHGDLCIILSSNTSAQSIYRYCTKDINGNNLSSPQWVWMTDLSLFAPQSVLELKGEKKEVEHTETDSSGLTIVWAITGEKFTWDYSKGNSAKLTIGDIYNSPEFANLEISNVNSGSYGVLDVFIAKYENSGYVTEDGVIIGSGSVNCELTLPENSYAFPPDWDYLKPNEGQHWRYSFYYDGIKFDWNRSVRNDE